MRIIELCASASSGDGVGNDMLTKAKLFRELGYSCEIYANAIDPKLKGIVYPTSQLEVNPDDILLHHYAGYTELVDFVSQLECVKVLVYHNITPPELVSPDMRAGCEQGMRQIVTLAGRYDYFVGVSQYDADDLRKLGVAFHADVMPILVEVDSCKVKRKEKAAGAPVNILFVGRIVPNKKHTEIVDIFEFYYMHYNKNAELYLVGATDASPDYFNELQEKIKTLYSRKCIHITGKVSDSELQDLYNCADIYLSMSQHEGFGIPLLEAMNFQIPVLAYDSSAVKETMGGAGILLESNDSAYVAKQIDSIISDKDKSKLLIEGQNARLKRSSRMKIMEAMDFLVKKWSRPWLSSEEDRKLYKQFIATRNKNCNDFNLCSEEKHLPVIDARDEENLELEALIDKMDVISENYAFRHIYSCRKMIGGLIVFCKRAIRKLLKWYIEPICFQQTDFNKAVTSTFRHMVQGQNRFWVKQNDLQAKQVDLNISQDNLQAKQEDLQKRQDNLQVNQEDLQMRQDNLQAKQEDLQKWQGSLQEKQEETQLTITGFCDERKEIIRQISELKSQLEYTSANSAKLEKYLKKFDELNFGIFSDDPHQYWERNKSSQCGEDGILNYALDTLHIPFSEVRYLDLGANHAKFLSNTNFFYQNGSRGVLVEANPALIPELKFYRGEDIILNRCVAPFSGKRVKFYVLNGDGLSSPDLTSVEDCLNRNHDLKIERIVEVESISIGDILNQYFDKAPTFINMDLEGSEMEILHGFDFNRYRPLLFIIETIPYRPNTLVLNEKNDDIVKFMESQGYMEYAFTGVNSIFIDVNQLTAGKYRF